MSDDFNPTSASDELARLRESKAAKLNHFRFVVEADEDLSDQEKTDLIDQTEQALDDAFFRLINSLESDLDWHASSVNFKQLQADVADIRGRQ